MSNQDIAFTHSPASIADGAYQQAVVKGVTESIVRSLMRFIPSLGTSDDPFTDEHKVELRKGYALRWAETNPARYFIAADGNWVEKPEAEAMKAKAEKFVLDVHTAFAYTQQAYGALKNEDPTKHAIVGDVRTRFNKFVSNCLGDLKREAVKIYKRDNNIQATRAPVALFTDWLTEPNKGALSVIRQRCLNAKAKGDETANIEKLDKALAAFKAKMQ
jgi:hypothetical protein